MRESPRHHALLGLVLLLPLALGAWWLGLDDRPEAGLCCELVPDLRGAVDSLHGDAQPWRSTQGWVQLLGWPGLRLGSEDGPLQAMLLSVTALQVGQYLSARTLAGRRAGLLAAALAPMVPLIALAQRRFDVFAPQCALLSLALAALLHARALSRASMTLLLGGMALALFTSSPHPTDNYLAMVALGGMTAGAWGRGLLLGRGALGEAVSRRRALGMGLALLAAVLVALPLAPSVGDAGDTFGLAYYLGEAGDARYGGLDPRSPQALGAYAVHLFWRGFGPALGVPLVLGALLWLWRGRGRAELIGAVLPLGLLLSLMAKKNLYYLAPAWPALCLLPALGVAALPWRPARWAAAGLTLSLGAAQLGARAFPSAVAGTPLAGAFAPRFDQTLGGAFQSSDSGMDLAPRAAGFDKELAEATAALTPSACDCPYATVIAGSLPRDGWWLRRVAEDPCTRLLNPPLLDREADVGLVMLGAGQRFMSPHDQQELRSVAQWADQALEARGELSHPDARVRLFARDETWFTRRCARGR